MRPLTIFTTARTLRDYSPDCDVTLDELLKSDPKFNGQLKDWFSSIFMSGFANDHYSDYGFTDQQFIDFLSWLRVYASQGAYLEYRRRKCFTNDYNEFYDHVESWGTKNMLYYFAKFVAVQKQVTNAAMPATESENYEENVTRNGTNNSTSSIESANTSKEKANAFGVWDTTAEGFDDKMQSNGRSLQQNGNSTGTNNATANATEKRTYTREHATSNGRTPIELQEDFVKRISNITQQIIDDFGQFFNGNLLVY